MEAVPLPDARLRLASSFLALVSLGLFLSLLPRTSFVSRSADEIVDAVGPVWPEASVEQVLDPGQDVVSEIRIWAAAGLDRGEAPVVAALLQGPDRELVRQATVKVQASKLLQPYVIQFPPYRPVPAKELTLQLWVSSQRSNHAIFGTGERRDHLRGPTLSRQPTDHGPLVYEAIWRGDGWRAALEGSWVDRLRLAGGMAAAAMALLLRPWITRALLRNRCSVHRVIQAPIKYLHQRLCRAWLTLKEPRPRSTSSPAIRDIYVFPWLIPVFAILHYIASNLILIRPYESIIITIAMMIVVTLVYIALRIILTSTAAAAVYTGLVGIAFFSYGHFYTDTRVSDERFLLGIGIPVAIGVGVFLRRRANNASALARTMNIASLILIILPVYQIGLILFAGHQTQDQDYESLSDFSGLDERIQETKARISPEEFPDIYYMILDQYPRHGSPESFDNSSFVRELTNRGFYVDPHARSNYTRSAWSISSSLDMTHTDEQIPYGNDQDKLYQIYKTFIDHNLGRIMKALGYKYVHVSSGWYITETSPRADLVVSFGPSGRIVTGLTTQDPCIVERIFSLSNRFTDGFLETTAGSRFMSSDPRRHIHDCTYHWSHPGHTLEWLTFMKESAYIDGPKFVFGHLIKPHSPYIFDRYGNVSPGPKGWDNTHDPTVNDAFYGQLIWLNQHILDVIDAILDHYEEPPIIVIMGDHGFERSDTSKIANNILAAYLLPDGGAESIYPGITSVNSFRTIFNRYFDLEIEMLRDSVRHL